jgi:hypothetical protein
MRLKTPGAQFKTELSGGVAGIQSQSDGLSKVGSFFIGECAMGKSPEAVFRLGSVRASVFVNEGERGPFRTVTLQRSYQDNAGNWQTSDSFTSGHAAVALAVLQRALNHVLDRESQTGAETGAAD